MVAPIGKNCSDFIKRRPPMVLFLLCLVFLVLSLITLTFYIKYAARIIDNDSKQTWLSLVKYMNKAHFCRRNDSNLKTQETVELSSFAALIDVNVSGFGQLRGVEMIATYNLWGWNGGCAGYNPLNTTAMVRFMLDENQDSKTCALFQGPKHYLPHLSHGCQYDSDKYVDYRSLNVTNDRRWCDEKGAKIRFDFRGPNLVSFLSEKDRNLIFIHLMWSIYVLVFCILIVTGCVMFTRHDDRVESLVYR